MSRFDDGLLACPKLVEGIGGLLDELPLLLREAVAEVLGVGGTWELYVDAGRSLGTECAEDDVGGMGDIEMGMGEHGLALVGVGKGG